MVTSRETLGATAVGPAALASACRTFSEHCAASAVAEPLTSCRAWRPELPQRHLRRWASPHAFKHAETLDAAAPPARRAATQAMQALVHSMADAESRARWEFARRAACTEARRGLAPTNGDGDASPRPIRISASGGAPWRPARWRRAFVELVSNPWTSAQLDVYKCHVAVLRGRWQLNLPQLRGTPKCSSALDQLLSSA